MIKSSSLQLENDFVLNTPSLLLLQTQECENEPRTCYKHDLQSALASSDAFDYLIITFISPFWSEFHTQEEKSERFYKPFAKTAGLQTGQFTMSSAV